MAPWLPPSGGARRRPAQAVGGPERARRGTVFARSTFACLTGDLHETQTTFAVPQKASHGALPQITTTAAEVARCFCSNGTACPSRSHPRHSCFARLCAHAPEHAGRKRNGIPTAIGQSSEDRKSVG